MQKKPYENLLVWKEADILAKDIFKHSSQWPNHYLFTLGKQIQRASLSVVLNIVEGNARYSKNDYRHFLIQSRGSLAETGYLLSLSFHFRLLNQEQHQSLTNLHSSVSYLLQRLIDSFPPPQSLRSHKKSP